MRGLCVLGLMGACFVSGAAGLTLAEDGLSRYVISADAKAIPAERTAAQELQSHIEMVTGARLPVRDTVVA